MVSISSILIIIYKFGNPLIKKGGLAISPKMDNDQRIHQRKQTGDYEEVTQLMEVKCNRNKEQLIFSVVEDIQMRPATLILF